MKFCAFRRLATLTALGLVGVACGGTGGAGSPDGSFDAAGSGGGGGFSGDANAQGGSAGAGGSGGGAAGGAGGSGGSVAAGGAGGSAGTDAGGGGGSEAGGDGGADGGVYIGTKTPGTAQAGDISIAPATTYQVVDGFGEADVWQTEPVSAAQQTLLFDPVNGIGLTLLRVGIESSSGTSVIMGNAGLSDGPAITKFGGKVWAAPWSPPAADKENNNVNGGASNNLLNTSDYEAWATTLAAFPAYYKQQTGVDLYAISAQNEPDFNATYEACLYTASDLVNFIDVLGPKLAALSPPVKVLAAEPDSWSNLWGSDGYGLAILADSMATSFVGPIATHDYGTTSAGTYARPAPPASNTHHVWETECTPGDTGAITTATMIYAAFATGGASAWHYWWTESLLPKGASNPPPQLYAIGNFSKFVRPGYYRVDVTGAPTPSGSTPLVVAFTNPADATVAIVVVNGGGAQQVSFFVSGTAWPASVTPYVTSASSSLAAGAVIPLAGARFSASLAAQSVSTFVGKP
jgi:glucuronoarabinoxylan endo-1,4-beta-xylanase